MSPLSGNVSSNFIGHFCLHPPNLMRWDPDYSISHWFPYCFEKNPSACNCLNFQLFQNSLNSAPHVGISEKWCFHARRIFQNDRSGLFLGWLMSGGSAEYTWYEPDIPFFGGSRPAWTDALLALIAVQRANMLLSILELCTKKHVIPGGSWRSLYVKKKGPASMVEEASLPRRIVQTFLLLPPGMAITWWCQKRSLLLMAGRRARASLGLLHFFL